MQQPIHRAGARGLKIEKAAACANTNLEGIEVIDAPHSHAAAEKAVALAHAGRVRALMKGSLHTDELMAAAVHAETGLRTERRMSHVFALDVPHYHKLLFISDAAVNICPTVIAPLDTGRRLDPVAWCSQRAQCRGRRFWHGEPDRYGLLVDRRGGADGATWVIDYDRDRDDDEAGCRLGTHTFRVGDYLSIRDADGALKTFKVAEVRPVEHELARP